jgi:hypothetical protein
MKTEDQVLGYSVLTVLYGITVTAMRAIVYCALR